MTKQDFPEGFFEDELVTKLLRHGRIGQRVMRVMIALIIIHSIYLSFKYGVDFTEKQIPIIDQKIMTLFSYAFWAGASLWASTFIMSMAWLVYKDYKTRNDA